MLQAKLKQILDIQKQYPNFIDIFLQDYQEQFQALFKVIQYDSKFIKKGKCCQCLQHIYFKLTLTREDKLKLINIQLYDMLQAMTIQERQDFIIELFQYLKVVYIKHEEILQNGLIKNHYEFKKKLLQTVLQKSGQFVQDTSLDLEELKAFLSHDNQDQKSPLHVIIKIDEEFIDKIAIFQQFKMILFQIEHLEQSIRLDLRNYYYLPQKSLSTHHFTLVAFDKIIIPSKLSIKIDQPSIEKVKKYSRLIKWISVVGILERLVNSINVAQVLGQQEQNKRARNNLFLTVLTFSMNQLADNEGNNGYSSYINSLDILIKDLYRNVRNNKKQSHTMVNKKMMLEQKKSLIQILNQLAEKKQNENKRISEFLTKESKTSIIPHFKNISEMINNKQSIILPRKEPIISKNIIAITGAIPELFNAMQSLKIINQHSNHLQSSLVQNKDPFYQDNQRNQEKKIEFNKKFYGNVDNNQMKSKVYKKSIYYKMYPEEYYKISRIQNISKLQLVPYPKNMYLLSQKVMAQQFKNSKKVFKNDYASFKEIWRVRIQQIKIFLRLDRRIFKIYIPLQVDHNTLVEAIVDILSYSRWHPNIKESSIQSVVQSQNSLIFSIITEDLHTNKLYKVKYLFHLFKIDNKYYIALKYLPPQSKNKFLSIFSFSKQKYSPPATKLSYVLIRISKGYGNGTSQLNFTVQYEDNKSIKLNQIYDFFINFFFIRNYWKKEEEVNNVKSNLPQNASANKKIQSNPASLRSGNNSLKSSELGLANGTQKLSVRFKNKSKCLLNLDWQVKYDYGQQIFEEQEIKKYQDKDNEFNNLQNNFGLQKIESSLSLAEHTEYFDF